MHRAGVLEAGGRRAHQAGHGAALAEAPAAALSRPLALHFAAQARDAVPGIHGCLVEFELEIGNAHGFEGGEGLVEGHNGAAVSACRRRRLIGVGGVIVGIRT